MACKYNSEDFCTNQDCHNEGTNFCVKSLYGNYCKYYEEAQKKPAPTPDYNQLVADLLTRRDQLRSILRNTEAELEEIEDFLDALDNFFDRVPPGKIKPTKAVPNHQLWAYGCKFCHASVDGVVCKNPEINDYSCVLFYGDDQTHCCGWEAKKDND